MERVDEEKEDDEGAVRAAAVYLRLLLSRVLLRVSAAHDLAEAPIGNIFFSQLGNYLGVTMQEVSCRYSAVQIYMREVLVGYLEVRCGNRGEAGQVGEDGGGNAGGEKKVNRLFEKRRDDVSNFM